MLQGNVFGIIFSNMHDDLIGELTQVRTTGSIPFGGRYRFIDFHLSNFVNSGITEVGVITKMNYQSLMDHLGSGREWDLDRKNGGLYIIPPFTHMGASLYRGRIEALSGVLPLVRRSKAGYIVMADCNVLYNVDLTGLVESHIASGADITAAYSRQSVNSHGRWNGMTFSLAHDSRITDVVIGGSDGGEVNSAINLFVMNKSFFLSMVETHLSRSQYSFKRDVLQARRDELRIYGYPIEDYCVEIDSLRGYYDANMQLLDRSVCDQLFKRETPVYTKVRDEAPARYGLEASVENSLIAEGCIIEGEVRDSVLFRGVRVGRGAKVVGSILMQGTVVGEGADLGYVVADKDVHFSEGRLLRGYEAYPMYITKGSHV